MITQITNTIDVLHLDVLLHIFNYLNLKDQLSVSKICKDWSDIISSIWKKRRTLNSRIETWGMEGDVDGKIVQIIFENLGSNLVEIDFNHNCFEHLNEEREVRSVEGINAMIKNCKNLVNVGLCTCIIDFEDADLKNLFNQNKNLEIVHINYLDHLRTCIDELSVSKLKKLSLTNSVINIEVLLALPNYINLILLSLNNSVVEGDRVPSTLANQIKKKLKKLQFVNVESDFVDSFDPDGDFSNEMGSLNLPVKETKNVMNDRPSDHICIK